MKRNLLETFGMISSLKNIFPPSAKGCNKPQGPALSGPTRSCKKEANLRSHQVEYAATPNEKAKTTTQRIPLYISKLIICSISFQEFLFLFFQPASTSL